MLLPQRRAIAETGAWFEIGHVQKELSVRRQQDVDTGEEIVQVDDMLDDLPRYGQLEGAAVFFDDLAADLRSNHCDANRKSALLNSLRHHRVWFDPGENAHAALPELIKEQSVVAADFDGRVDRASPQDYVQFSGNVRLKLPGADVEIVSAVELFRINGIIDLHESAAAARGQGEWIK